MPKKKETSKKKVADKIKEEPIEPTVVEMEDITQAPAHSVVSDAHLDLKFEKVYLRDANDIYVGNTTEVFSIDGKEYDGKEFFLIMFGGGELFAVAKKFFTKIAQIMPT